MDLRGMLNDNNGPAAAVAASSGQPPQAQQIHIQTQAPPHPPLPSTPVQGVPQQSFRDYNHSQTQQSPSRQYSQDYGAQHVPPGAFASSPFQAGPGLVQYPNRPSQPPPLQQIAPNDLRSPGIGSGPAPSPYRPTPTSSISTASGGYPFPPPQQTPTSPVQRHQYPPTSAYHRDGYPQPPGAVGITGPPGAPSYMQGPPLPQTPPIGTAGGHSYPHQRSQSSQSTPTPTPTSAQSQSQTQSGQYGSVFIHGSPVATAHSLPQMDHPQRQSSQPPTPIAGPLTGGPRPVQNLNFPQPPSPYQQRLPSTVAYHPLPSQTSPPPPPPPSLPRHPSSQSLYEPHSQDQLRRPPSHSDRDRSVSISPKTRVPSLPSSAGRPGTSVSDSDARHVQTLPSALPSALGPAMDIDRERDPISTPAKRKLDDRELRPDELERRDVRPPPFENIPDRPAQPEPTTTNSSVSTKRPRRRMIHQSAPTWAQSSVGRNLKNANCVLYKPSASHNHQVNGKAESLLSRHASPEERRATLVAQAQAQAAPPPPPAAQPAVQQMMEPPYSESLLGPWEPSITNQTPQGSMSKKLCDFFFANVLMNENLSELESQNIKFEIEAKFGTLIHRDTNQRVSFPVETDCVLSNDSGRLGFRSSMTEAQHRSFNESLNDMVKAAHPDNKANAGRPRRVPIKYQHRREKDKFFELPKQIRDQHLPPYVKELISSRDFAAKVRVTYDQKTNEVLAKIIKARIADMHLFFPESPLDCRISINLEMDWDGPVESLENMAKLVANPNRSPDRLKDRLSYAHGPYQVDLTQVTQVNAKQHELEIEVNPAAIIDQGQRVQAGQPHQYPELVEGFLNNITLLARKAASWGP